jgi:hypothetical protein
MAHELAQEKRYSTTPRNTLHKDACNALNKELFEEHNPESPTIAPSSQLE